MATQHTLTTDQLRMLVDAMHGDIPTSLTLSTSQLSQLVGLTGGGGDWPKHTDDPLVNFAVDCVMVHDMVGEGEEEPVFDSALYAADIEAWAAHFGRS